MDLILIDKELPEALASKVLQDVHDAFDLHYVIECFSVVNGQEAFKILEEKKSSGYVGSFAIVTNEKNVENFKKEFPNNTIATKELLDEVEINRVAKQVVWVLTCFGREMLRVKSDFMKRMSIRSK